MIFRLKQLPDRFFRSTVPVALGLLVMLLVSFAPDVQAQSQENLKVKFQTQNYSVDINKLANKLSKRDSLNPRVESRRGKKIWSELRGDLDRREWANRMVGAVALQREHEAKRSLARRIALERDSELEQILIEPKNFGTTELPPDQADIQRVAPRNLQDLVGVPASPTHDPGAARLRVELGGVNQEAIHSVDSSWSVGARA